MGTSASSNGPSSGIPMVPPWVPDAPASPPEPPQPDPAAPANDSAPDQGQDDGALQQPGEAAPARAPLPIPLAPPARFKTARLNIGKFAKSGDGRHLRRGLGHYVRTGYGGAGTAARRFGGTASTADALNGALSSLAAGRVAAPGSILDRALLTGRTTRQIIDALIEAVRPADGTQDAEASRASINDALSEVLTVFSRRRSA